MHQPADAPGPIGQSPRRAFGEGDKLRGGLRTDVWIDDQDQWIGVDQADGSEILERVVGQLFSRRRNGNRADAAEAERVSVRRRLRDGVGAQQTSSADAIFDNHVGTESFLHVGRGDTADHVGVAARRERNDQPDEPVRIDILCHYGLRDSQRTYGQS